MLCHGRSHKFEAYVVDIKTDSVMYPACAKCNKKVVDLSNGSYRSVKKHTSLPDIVLVYVLHISVD